MSQIKRIAWPDISKGIGILLVVLYHSFIPKLRGDFGFFFAYSFISTIIMPLFFFVSGWIFELKSDKYQQNKVKSIGNKFTHLMIPYFSFSILYYIAINIALRIDFFAPMLNMSNGGYEKFGFLESAIQILTFQDSMAKSLWFIYMLFILSAIHILFPKFMKHPVVVIAQFFLPFLNFLFTSPDIIMRVFIFSAYFAVGRLAFNYTDIILKMKKYIYMIISILYVASASIYSVASYHGLFTQKGTIFPCLNIFIKAFMGLTGIVFICVGANYISKISKISKPLTYIGKKSLIIYLIHAPILTQAIVSLMIKLLPSIPPVINCIAATIISVVVSILISEFIFNKIPILNTVFAGAPLKRKNKRIPE